MCWPQNTRGRQLSALTVLLVVFFRGFVTCTEITAEEDHQCKAACASIQGDVSSADACAKPRKTLPRPKIGQICQEAYTEAFKLTCLEVCQLHNTGRPHSNRLGEACNKRKRDVPKPVAHKACVEGFRAGFADTSALIIKKIEEITAASDNTLSEHSTSLLETLKVDEHETTLETVHVDKPRESQQRVEDRATGYGDVSENYERNNSVGEVSPCKDEHGASNESQEVEVEKEKTKDGRYLETQGIPKADAKLTPQMEEESQDDKENDSEEIETTRDRDHTPSDNEDRTASRVASDVLLKDIAGDAGDDLPAVGDVAEADEHVEQEVSVDVLKFHGVTQAMESDDSLANVEDELSENTSDFTYGFVSVDVDDEGISNSDPEGTQNFAGGVVKDGVVSTEGNTMAGAQPARTRSDETEMKDTADRADVQEVRLQSQESEHDNGLSNTEGGEPPKCDIFGDPQDTAGGSRQDECLLTTPAHDENNQVDATGTEDGGATIRTSTTIAADHESAVKTKNVGNKPDDISGQAGIGVHYKSSAHAATGRQDETERVEALGEDAHGHDLRQQLGGGEDEQATSVSNTTTITTTAATNDGDSHPAAIDDRLSSSSILTSDTIPAAENIRSVWEA